MYWTNKLISLSPSSKTNLVFLYRMITLVLTSIFFLLTAPFISLWYKLAIITFLALAAWIVSSQLPKHMEYPARLKAIVLTETFSLTLLLIPTGGIESPFIWYASNPVLVAASFLTPLFCWAVLTFYLISATAIAYFINPVYPFFELIQENSHIFLVCILCTSLLVLYSSFTKEIIKNSTMLETQQKRLLQMNEDLFKTNEMYKNTLGHIMSIYHLMNNFSAKKSIDALAADITSALASCTQKSDVFLWIMDLNEHKSYMSNLTGDREIENSIRKNWHKFCQQKESFSYRINTDDYVMKMVKTSKSLGLLGMKLDDVRELNQNHLLKYTFEFLSDLGEMMLENIYFENTMDELMITEEQNRIANEIHDNVSQKLFGIVYSLHSLQKKSETILAKELTEEYQFLTRTANSAMKELRASIYRLSSAKKDEKPFEILIKNYLDEYSKLNDIMIAFDIKGNESLLQSNLKLNLYRIISEACGNAVRHGQCKKIVINMSLADGHTSLVIQDDGIGFEEMIEKPQKEKGIGLMNIKRIVHIFGGSFLIDGVKGKGTTIQIDIPNNKSLQLQENY